jgi:flagellar basal-body rod protein FlgG
MHQGWDMAAYMGVRATRELDIVSHNLANASTGGFKRELLNSWRLKSPETTSGNLPPALYVDVRSRDYAQGGIHETGNDTDLAIQGLGFFKVETPRGVRYTRNGAFHLNSESKLVTKEGYPVLGKNGPVTLDARDQKFTVDEQGGIHLDNGLADQLQVVEFANPQDLRVEGQTYYSPGPDAGGETEPKNARIIQGSVEESNVDLVAESVDLIDLHRRFESYLKVLETFAASDRKVVEEVGQQV